MRHFNKRFKRNKQYRLIGGVCSGMGDYFDVDPFWLRILFILGLFSPYPFLIIYFLFWFLTPYSDVEVKNYKNDKYSNEI